MAQYQANTRGDLADRVRLVLAGEEVLVAEGYEVHQGVLTQPCAFSLRLGHGAVVRELADRYPPRTKFQLFIGEALRFTGYVDALVQAGDGGATALTINGRDALAQFHDAYIRADKSYANRTYGDLVFSVIKDATGEATVIANENTDNRLTQAGLSGAGGAGAQSGVNKPRPGIVALPGQASTVAALIRYTAGVAAAPPEDSEEDRKQALAASKAKSGQGAMLAKAGERYYEFLKKELDRAGLCLWAAADGEAYVLAAPDGNQAPIGRRVRKRGTSGNVVNALTARYTNDTSKRFSSCVVYGRGGTPKSGRTKSEAEYTDDEMVALGFNRPKVVRDSKCANAAQAEYLARRHIAEANRAGVTYHATVAGHAFPALGSGERAVWTPDTVIDIDDDEFGIHGPWYLEQVAFRRSPQTITELTFIRIQDLVFATDAPT